MIRVREAIDSYNIKQKLRPKIPKAALEVPDCEPHKYPGTLLKHIDYCTLGIVTEKLLQSDVINTTELARLTKKTAGVVLEEKLLGLKSTTEYLARVVATRAMLKEMIGPESAKFEPAITVPGCVVHGHPDVLTPTQIFEIKTTETLKASWISFMYQVFCYAALYPQAKKVHLVLPLQNYIWTYDFEEEEWPKRNVFLEVLKSLKKDKKTNESDADAADPMFAPLIMSAFKIGMHVSKKKSLFNTVQPLHPKIPFQLFLSMTSKINIKDAEILKVAEIVAAKQLKVFIHCPYIINLSMEPGTNDDYVVSALKANLETAAKCGFSGVVVHVGKSVKMPIDKAIENMKANILQSLDSATESCPLLLETPAGQGTELLTKQEDFVNFVKNIPDKRFGICLDTCHVFAAGEQPFDYLFNILSGGELLKRKLKLIHYNDSLGKLGSRVDRHAKPGEGHIPKEQLVEIARMAKQHNIPMLLEN